MENKPCLNFDRKIRQIEQCAARRGDAKSGHKLGN